MLGADYGTFFLEDFDVANDTLEILVPSGAVTTGEPFSWTDPALDITEISSEQGDYTQINIEYIDPVSLLNSTGTINILGVDLQTFNDFIA